MSHVIGHGRYSRETYPEARSSGAGPGGCLTPLDRVICCDAGTTTPLASQNGSISCPFASIQDAIDSVAPPVTSPDTVIPIVVSIAPGVYDEDVLVPGTRTWSLAGWDGANGVDPGSAFITDPTGAVSRSITWKIDALPIAGIALTVANLIVVGDLNIEDNVGVLGALQLLLERSTFTEAVQSTGLVTYTGFSVARRCLIIEVAINFGLPGAQAFPSGLDGCAVGSITTPFGSSFSAAQSTIALIDTQNPSDGTTLTECLVLLIVALDDQSATPIRLIDTTVLGGSLNNWRGEYDATSFKFLHELGIVTGPYAAVSLDTEALSFERTVLDIGDTSFDLGSMRSINTVIAAPTIAHTVILPPAITSAYASVGGVEGVGTRGIWVKNRGPGVLSVVPDGADTINTIAAPVLVPGGTSLYFIVTDTGLTNWETMPT